MLQLSAQVCMVVYFFFAFTSQQTKVTTLWIGGLGVRHDVAWMMQRFASHKLQRVLERTEGYAICEFSSDMAEKVIADYNNVKVDRKKFVVKLSKRCEGVQ